ncbi:ribonuclease YeeF family protein [Sutcliffiella horikoshii]|uniref:ribonuclease YeeF family protein n=1 Tax=Sutcliffiella horikoshii TaxID=79883 RepID=UPI003850C1E6
MMKVLDVPSLHEGIRGMTQQLSQLEKQLNGVENSIRSFVASKDSFRGKGANAIRRFYEYAHLPFLQFFQSFLTNFQSKLQQLQFEMDGLEGDSRGFIDESFLSSELEDGLNQINRMVAELTGETNSQLSRVSDIVYLPRLQDHQFHEGIQHAKQSAKQTVDKLHQFDHQQTQSFTELVEDLSLIKRYIEEMNQQFESGKINVKSFSPVMLQNLEAYGQLQTRLYNQTVMQRWNSQHYPELGVFYSVGHAVSFDKWVNPSCARPEPKGVVESGVDFTKGLLKGGFAVVKETVEFAGRVLTEPDEVIIETVDFVAAVADDPGILLEIGQSLIDSFNDQVVYGTAETRGEWFGYALATVAGGKGITSIPKIAKAGKLGKLGGGPGRQMQHKVQLMIESQKAKLKDFSNSVKGAIKTQQAAIKGTAAGLKASGINKVRELMKDFLLPNNQSQLSLAGGPYNTIDSANINRKLEDNKKDIIDRIEVEAGKGTNKDIKNYRKTFFDKYPELEGSVIVHHAIEQQVLKKYPNLFSLEEIHALENLRGIPKEINSDIHLSKIRKDWNRFYRNHPNPTKEDMINYMIELDKKYGKSFNPPLKR